MKNFPPVPGLLLLLDELYPEWYTLQGMEKNLDVPSEQSDLRSEMDDAHSSASDPEMDQRGKQRPRLKIPRKRRYRF